MNIEVNGRSTFQKLVRCYEASGTDSSARSSKPVGPREGLTEIGAKRVLQRSLK